VAEFLSVNEHRAEKLVLESDSELVFEAISPVGVLGQLSHGSHEATREELLGNVEALKFVHGLHLLLTLGTRIVQGLVLLLDQVDLAFDLLLPLVLVVLCALLVLLFEFTDFLQLRLFFDLEDGLLD